ncbi:MAG TPA: DinB family protein [Thermoanaerobaculia bacterium]|nr:DinB family protein [Thermoanaerobaculia bacterium]
MNADDVRKLYRYNDWANARLLATIAELPDEAFTRTIVSSFPSIRDTVAHIAFAEWLWLGRWRGAGPSGMPAWSRDASFAVLRETLQEIAVDREAYLRELTDAAVGSTIDYVSTEGDPFTMPLADLFVHCANHSTYHRGQLVTMLRQVGAEPPNMDYSRFARA